MSIPRTAPARSRRWVAPKGHRVAPKRRRVAPKERNQRSMMSGMGRPVPERMWNSTIVSSSDDMTAHRALGMTEIRRSINHSGRVCLSSMPLCSLHLTQEKAREARTGRPKSGQVERKCSASVSHATDNQRFSAAGVLVETPGQDHTLSAWRGKWRGGLLLLLGTLKEP